MSPSLTKWLRTRGLVVMLFVATGFASLPLQASATTSPNQCDATPKYYCTNIVYNISGSTYTVQERNWRGAIDGGAERWRLYFANDYYGQFGQPWIQDNAYGPTSWLSNLNLGSWWCGCFNNPLPGGGKVEMQIEYEECVPSGCYPWYSPVMIHYLT